MRRSSPISNAGGGVIVQNADGMSFWRMDDTPLQFTAKMDMAAKTIALTKTPTNGTAAGTLTYNQTGADRLVFDGTVGPRAVHMETRLRRSHAVPAAQPRVPLDPGIPVQSVTDAVVIGSGPNGLAAAITLARAGRSVRVYEAQPTVGGGMRSAELTQPGSVHDVCATVVSLALVSPFLKTLPLAEHGLELVHPDAPFAHPFDDGTAVVVERSVDATADGLGAADGRAYRRLMTPLVADATPLMETLLGPFGDASRVAAGVVRAQGDPFGRGLARSRFTSDRARAMFAGVAAHSMVPLDYAATAGYGLGLIIAAHAVGWPVARGGSQHVADAMASYLRSLGGEIVTGERIESLAQLPPLASGAVRRDAAPVSAHCRRPRAGVGTGGALEAFRHGPGVFKMDWALSAPVPWRAEACRRAGTLHLGGTLDRDRRAASTPHGMARAATVPTSWPCSRACSTTPRAGGDADALGVLSCAARLAAGHVRASSSRRSNDSHRDSATDRGAARDGPGRARATQREPDRRRHRRRRGATGADLHAPRRELSIRTRRRSTACTCARRLRLPASACMGCAATTPRRPRSATSPNSSATAVGGRSVNPAASAQPLYGVSLRVAQAFRPASTADTSVAAGKRRTGRGARRRRGSR